MLLLLNMVPRGKRRYSVRLRDWKLSFEKTVPISFKTHARGTGGRVVSGFCEIKTNDRRFCCVENQTPIKLKRFVIGVVLFFCKKVSCNQGRVKGKKVDLPLYYIFKGSPTSFCAVSDAFK